MRRFFPFSAFLVLSTPSFTQGQDAPGVTPLALGADVTVEIDAVLDEPFWSDAPLLGPLTETEPFEGTAPSHATDVRLAYDRDYLYIGIVCHDDPDAVRAKQMGRDEFVRYDDLVELWIDTFNDQRFAFWFQISAGGSRGDALLADSGSNFNKSWDGIWYGRSRVTDEGWVAEIALPFKTLAFEEGADTWGFNFQRTRVANGSKARWANPFVAYSFFKLAEGGELTGLRGMRQGLALDVTPYVKGGLAYDSVTEEDDNEVDIGLDIAWRPTPSTTLRLTTNTDFAETEVDDRQINLTRFPLFFPEKRDFFLEDAGVFEFGPSSGGPGRGGGGGGVRPFFSRNIGRDPDGEAVPLIAGIKFSGRVGDWNMGLLETRVDSFTTETEDVPERTLGVVRVSRNLGGESSAGLIFTHGRPAGTGSAVTYGADFRLGSSRFFGEGRSGSLWGYYVASSNEGADDGASYGLQAEARTAVWTHSLQAFITEAEYAPELGFVRRTGVEHYRYRLEHTWRGGPTDSLRRWRWSVSPHFDRDRIGEEDYLRLPVKWLDIQFHSEDSISIESTHSDETLDTGFDLTDTVTVSPGEYDGVRHVVELESNDRRLLTGDVRIEFGDFYSGDIVRTKVSPVFLPSKLFTWRLSYEDIRVDLDEGDFDTQVVSTNLDFAFDPDLSWANLVQYDTESDELAWQSRVHWILEPGRDLFLVGQFGWDRSGQESFVATTRELVLKLSYTWRF